MPNSTLISAHETERTPPDSPKLTDLLLPPVDQADCASEILEWLMADASMMNAPPARQAAFDLADRKPHKRRAFHQALDVLLHSKAA